IAEGIVRRVLENPENRAAAGTPITAWIDALVHKAREVADEAGI
ncbi:MAG TPA: phosphotransferase family protein, partial [Mycobacterium sp.]|nr:phosphotransferase family protein [Mycobacterium sp.]